MRYQQITTACLAEAVGDGGLEAAALARELEAAGGALERLRALRDEARLPLFALPAARADLAAGAEIAALLAAGSRDVLVLGMGGSSLGGQTLYALADRGFGPPAGRPRLHFVENVDPDSFAAMTASLDLARTGVLAVSKSGGTAETLMQLLALLPGLEAAVGRARLGRRVAAIAEPGGNPLRALCAHLGLPCLDHDPGVGGRFSVLSLVGMVPAILAGLDPLAIRNGAGEVLDATLGADEPAAAPPALGAALAVGLARERGAAISVMMTYLDRLADFGLWYCQLWAESLGKQGRGTTPVRARGAVDQHSQLQLYLDGPRDKLFTLIRQDTVGAGAVAADFSEAVPALAPYAGRALGDLLDAMARATAETLAANGRPLREFRLERLDEAALGALMMHFMLETILAADLLGVDPFDQPAVEQGKVLARAHLAERTAKVPA